MRRRSPARRVRVRPRRPVPNGPRLASPFLLVGPSLVLWLGIVVDAAQYLFDALAGEDAGVGQEGQTGNLPDAHLASDLAPEMRRSRPQSVIGVVGDGLAAVGRRGGHRRVVHLGDREVATYCDTGERYELEPRIRHALELVGEHFEHHLVDPGGARELARRRHDDSIHPVSTSMSSTSGADTTNRSIDASTSRTWVTLLPTTATPIAARCHWFW